MLSRFAHLYSTRRLLEAIEEQGLEPVLLAPEQCLLMLQGTQANLYYQGELLNHCAALIPRVGGPITRLGARLLRYFAGAGTVCLNAAEALELARDKFASLQVLVAAGIAVPQTVYFTEMAQRDQAVSLVGTPLIHKLLSGSQGLGVSMAETVTAARGMLDSFMQLQHEAMVQSFLSGREDIRVLVLYGEVIAAMRRRASEEDFRSNLHCGGHALMLAELPAAWAEVARQSALALGLGFAGVDLMPDQQGNPLVLEVNPVPSLEGIETITGINIASLMVTALRNRLASH